MKITDFVIGLGFDTSDFDHGMKTATQQIGNFKSTVLQAGAALGMAFSFKGLTFDFAKQVNQARQLGDYLGISATKLSSMQTVVQHFGADIGELNGLLVGFNQAKAGMDVGKIGVFQDLAKAGVSIDPLIRAKDATEMLLRLSEQMGVLNKRQKTNVAAALGLSPAMLDVLTKGRERLEALRKEFAEIRPVTEKAQKASIDWQAGLTELETRVGRYSDKISTGLLSGMNQLIDKTNDWIKANQGALDSVADWASGNLDKNITSIAAGLSALTAASIVGGAAKLASSFGLIKTATAGAVTSISRLAGWVGVLVSLWDVDPEKLFGEKIGKALNMKPGEAADAFKKWWSGLWNSDEGAAETDYPTVRDEGAAVTASVPTEGVSGADKPPFAPSAPKTVNGKPGVAQINNNIVVKIGGETIDRRVKKCWADLLDNATASAMTGADM